MKRKIISVLKYLLFLSVGLGLLWLVFRKVDIETVIRQILNADYSWILFSMVIALISHISRAIRWNLLIDSMGYKTRTSTTFYAVMIGYFANLAIPRIGEITRCGVLSRYNKIPVNSLIGTVISERVFDMITLMVLIVLVIVFQLDLVGDFVHRTVIDPLAIKFSDNLSAILLLAAGAIVLLAILLIIRNIYKERLHDWPLYMKFRELFAGFLNGIKTIKRMKRKWYFLFHTLVIWTMYFLMTYVAFFAFSSTSNLTIVDGLTVMAIGSLGIVAPVPGGIGAYHFIVKAVLVELYAVSSEAATTFATILHSSQTILLIIMGVFSYFMFFLLRKRRKIYANA